MGRWEGHDPQLEPNRSEAARRMQAAEQDKPHLTIEQRDLRALLAEIGVCTGQRVLADGVLALSFDVCGENGDDSMEIEIRPDGSVSWR